MKFYNTTVAIDKKNNPYSILNNSETKSALIITIQVINNNVDTVDVTFRRKNGQDFDSYISKIIVKQGTTVLDHLIVVQSNQSYWVQSSSTNVVISCSYGI